MVTDVTEDHLKKGLSELLEIMDLLIAKFPRRLERPKLPILAIYLTIYDLADAMTLLFANGILGQVPTLIRSAIDSLYDLKLLEQDLENANFLIAKALTESIKRYQIQLDPRIDNPSVSNDPDRRELLKQNLRYAQKGVKELAEKGFKPLNQLDKFEKLGDKTLHGMVVNILNKEAHNSIDILVKRHIVLSSESKIEFTLTLHKKIAMQTHQALPCRFETLCV